MSVAAVERDFAGAKFRAIFRSLRKIEKNSCPGRDTAKNYQAVTFRGRWKLEMFIFLRYRERAE